ncbi:helix-turn-helix transcriptional regulator [Acinetobacter sp. YH12239]|uniref:helix-turn-helix domain-containing protein n=1 Tax=Acinetobacter sp. YH12239 TaxID=2601166 RepID=UPI0015D167B9|nr:helix-turn-helix transcriptional regulator [Acinetobacter sp. YH12239]
MDKRLKPLTPIEQMQNREKVLNEIRANPDWPLHQVAKYLRTELNLTLEEMSKITKIAPITLHKMEQSNANPTLGTILKLLNTFGLKICVK